MAKKNKPTKKHRLKYSQPTTVVGAGVTPAPAVGPVKTAGTSTAAARPVAAGRDFSFVAGDLRRLAGFAVGLIGLELVLWYLLGHTGLGSTVYSLISI